VDVQKEIYLQKDSRIFVQKFQAFIAIDCGALPKELAGSELFRARQSAFTGAIGLIKQDISERAIWRDDLSGRMESQL